uniref:Uncharacterized protein n=1 Tax=Globodera pallida TaxID=36090 RepID=A0A183C877_GLOPA
MLKLIRTFIQTGAKLKENKQMMIPFIKLPQQNRKTKVSGGIIRRKRAHDIECGPSGGCMRRWTKTQKACR